MKILVVVLILLLVLSCSDSEPPTQVIEPPEPVAKPESAEPDTAQPERVPPERAQYDIPEGIPQGLAEHFIDLQEHMTEFEWHLFLGEMKKTCDGRTPRSYFQAYLKDDLSDNALNVIRQLDKDGKLLPSELNTKRGRIRAAGLALPDVKEVQSVVTRGDDIKVVYLKHDYTILLDLFGTVDKSGVGAGRSGSWFSAANEFNAHDEERVHRISERLSETWENRWFEEYMPRLKAGEFAEVEPPERERIRGIAIPTDAELERVREFFENKFMPPDMPKDLDLLVIYLDQASNLISPNDAAELIVDYDDAPQATDEQLEAYNHIHSPDAYDCVE